MAGWTDRLGDLARIRRIRLRQPVLVILAGGSILFRSLPDFASVFSHLELLVPVFLSIITNSVDGAPIGEIATWFLYIYLIYEFTPRFFPAPVRPVVSSRGFRTLFTIMTLAAAVGFTVLPSALEDLSRYLGEGRSTLHISSNMLLFILMGTIVQLGPKIFLYYFGYTQGRISNKFLPRKENWQFKPVPKELVEYLRILNININHQLENSESVTAEKVWKWGSFSYMGTCLFPAIVIVVLSGLYPLPEIIVLLGVTISIFRWFAPTHHKAILDQLFVRNKKRVVDLEEHIFLIIGKTQHSQIGQVILILVLTGLAFASLMFTEGFQIARKMVFNPNNATLFRLSAATALLIAGIYGVWYWFSILLRLSSFIKWREEKEPNKKFHKSSEDFGPARPGGVMVAPILLTIIATVWWTLPDLVNPLIYLIAWASAIGITIWMVWKSKGAQAQPPDADMWPLPLPWAIHCFGAIIVFWVFTMDSIPVLPALAFVLIGPIIYFRVHLNLHSRDQRGYQYYLDIVFLAIVSLYWFGVLFASVWWLQSSYMLNIAFAIAGIVTLRDAARTYRHRVITI